MPPGSTRPDDQYVVRDYKHEDWVAVVRVADGQIMSASADEDNIRSLCESMNGRGSRGPDGRPRRQPIS